MPVALKLIGIEAAEVEVPAGKVTEPETGKFVLPNGAVLLESIVQPTVTGDGSVTAGAKLIEKLAVEPGDDSYAEAPG
jgi:hypothetical protein